MACGLVRRVYISRCFAGTAYSRADVLTYIAPFYPQVVYAIGISGWTGLTMSLSAISDVTSLLTMHLYVCYLVATTIFDHQLRTAGSLWNLFRGMVHSARTGCRLLMVFNMSGKRYNALRNRIDSWDYDVDQLLFGTILFTLVAFLFPTVLVYYLLFASVGPVKFAKSGPSTLTCMHTVGQACHHLATCER